ncbi:hypothetical protein FGG08_001077 [Glutinoglossum americanum]|uniref:Uncharacterized protein n=1 Tax=Glutinoglossum americanum TaxID=1670608 RepID=A0A9P8IC95_9PEZI|nr:hypothetical protein FGG08_001077 [Glutinoglossum americanum]
METPPTPSPTPNEARARKERLGAKIKARGAARLERITNMKEPASETSKPSDRPKSPVPSRSSQAPTDKPPLASETARGDLNSDPDEVDISQHFYTPGDGSRPGQQPQLSDEELLRLMFGQTTTSGQGQAGFEGPQDPFAPGPMGMNIGGGDPLTQMFREFIGGTGGPLGGTSDGALPQEDSQQSGSGMHTHMWKAVHAMFALSLGVYMAVTTSFVGTRAERRQESSALHVAPGISGVNFFWLFATVELLLQSTRFFLEKGRAPRDSWLGKIAMYLPPPFAGYLVVLARYSVIYTMIVQDGMLIVFVLGCVAWWNGGATA